MPEWAKASAALKGKVKLGNVDATISQGLAQKFGVNSYPTIKVFPGGTYALSPVVQSCNSFIASPLVRS
jgi:thioredoxin-like negative regulator of GroEL